MQRSSKEIVEWNMKKVDSVTIRFQRQMKEVCQRVRYDHFDVSQANLIVNNMLINLDLLDTDLERLLHTFECDDDDTVPSGKRTENLSDEKCGNPGPKSSRAVKDLTSDESRTTRLEENQSRTATGQQLLSGQEMDSTCFNNLVKQVKTLEGIVMSGKLVERVETMEQRETSQNVLQRLDTLESEVHPRDLSHQRDNIENDTQARLDVQQPVNSERQALIQLLSAINQIRAETEKTHSSSSSETGDEEHDVHFSVTLSHDGPWENGVVIRNTDLVKYNAGQAFDENKCWFAPPVDGIYKFHLKIRRSTGGTTIMQAWLCSAGAGGWVSLLFQMVLQGESRSKNQICVVALQPGTVVRLRVFGGTAFESCSFQGYLQTLA